MRAAGARTLAAAALLTAAAGVPATAGDWVAPPAERARVNPVAESPEAIRKGRALYLRHCTVCHGNQGRGDGPAGADARDLTDPEVQRRLTDGEIFWKIGAGRKKDGEMVMPAFGRQIGKQDRWKLVRFLRTLATDREPRSP